MDGKMHPVLFAGGPTMHDVPIGEPKADYRPESIGQGLLDLANWFDVYDDRSLYTGDRQVQRDLRNWAARTMHMKVDRTTVESDDFSEDDPMRLKGRNDTG